MSSGFPTPPPVPSPTAKMKSEFGWLTGVTVVGLTVISLFLCAMQYHRERMATLQVLESAALERVVTLDALLASAVRPVSALRQAAEIMAADPATPLPAGLRERVDAGGFVLEVPNGTVVTGPGSPHGRSAEFAESLRRVVGAAHVEPALARLAPNLASLGFRTPEGITALFPPTAATAETAASAAAPEPPAPQPFWSQVSHDKTSQNLMVSYAEPVFQGDHWLGTAFGDITLDFLHRVLEMPDYSSQRLVLVDHTRHVLADSRIGAGQGKDVSLALGEILPAKLVPDEVFSAAATGTPMQIPTHGYTVLVVPMTAAPWVLVCLVPEGALFLRVIPWFTIALVLIAALFGVLSAGHLYVSRRFIKPVLTLVRLVAAEASGDLLPPQRVPVIWQPLFGRVTGAFATGRVQLARANAEALQASRNCDECRRELAQSEVSHRRDAAEHHLSERALEGAPELVLVLDRDGRVVRFNSRCEEVSGIRAAAARGRHPWDFLVPPSDAELVRVQIATVLRGDGPISGLSHWSAPDGLPCPIQWSMAALRDSGGEVSHVVAIGHPCPPG